MLYEAWSTMGGSDAGKKPEKVCGWRIECENRSNHPSIFIGEKLLPLSLATGETEIFLPASAKDPSHLGQLHRSQIAENRIVATAIRRTVYFALFAALLAGT